MNKIKSLLDPLAELRNLYTGSKHEFSASKFHEMCDNKGPSITVCRSEHDHIFGVYSQYPYASNGSVSHALEEGSIFVFRLESPQKIVKVNLKQNTGIYHTAGYLTSFNYGMMLYDKANLNKSCCPTSTDHFEIPPELNIDVYTYWAGSQHFSLKEIEVY